ncbi:unnamed protein product, partial [Symbiodinium sp. CCMP2456]
WVRAAESFLQTPDAHLDFGYGVLLKAEAWAAGDGSLHQALSYVMSDQIQQELPCIFISGQGNSLE